ncbi:MAG TPA: isoamylase early set domain-containing protein [Phycisphaerae bacterium]|jgi:hypothetical protein
MVVQTGKGQVTFVVTPPVNGSKVFVAGCFNQWQPDPLRKQKDGTYRKSVDLPPGQYEYKYLVDDKWIEDPESPGYAHNPFGTRNSTFRVEAAAEVSAAPARRRR